MSQGTWGGSKPRSVCTNGHRLAGDNLYVSPSGMRQCIACRAMRQRRWYEANRQATIDRAAQWKRDNPEKVVASCRSRYLRKGDQMKAATERWRANNPEKKANHTEARRARKRNAFVEYVDRVLVHERDGGTCGICGEPVALSAMEVDHIIPLSRGGLHSYANVQASHMVCNRRKFNKVVTAYGA